MHVKEWPNDRAEQNKVLDSIEQAYIEKKSASQFHDVGIVHSEYREKPRPELFTLIKYHTDQDHTSWVMHGDLLFFINNYFYTITYALNEWSPFYKNVTGAQWINVIDKELQKIYSACEFKQTFPTDGLPPSLYSELSSSSSLKSLLATRTFT